MSTPFSVARSASVLPPHNSADSSSDVMPNALAAASSAAWLRRPKPMPPRGPAGATGAVCVELGAVGVGVVELCAEAAEVMAIAATTATKVAKPLYFFKPVIVHL